MEAGFAGAIARVADYYIAGSIFQEAEGDGISKSQDFTETCGRGRSRVTPWRRAHTSCWTEMRLMAIEKLNVQYLA